jgi:hypothetical protein
MYFVQQQLASGQWFPRCNSTSLRCTGDRAYGLAFSKLQALKRAHPLLPARIIKVNKIRWRVDAVRRRPNGDIRLKFEVYLSKEQAMNARLRMLERPEIHKLSSSYKFKVVRLNIFTVEVQL